MLLDALIVCQMFCWPLQYSLLPPDEFLSISYRGSSAEIKKERQKIKKMSHELHALRMDLLYKLSVTEYFRKSVFWLPSNLDFRGRVYPVPPHCSHIGKKANFYNFRSYCHCIMHIVTCLARLKLMRVRYTILPETISYQVDFSRNWNSLYSFFNNHRSDTRFYTIKMKILSLITD